MRIINNISLILLMCFSVSNKMKAQQKTYCSPINIDYGYTPFERFSVQGKHRATADPVIINFKEKLFLFSTNQKWSVIVDKSDSRTDVPHDYIKLKNPATARYLRLENLHMSTWKFALSGFRVLGKGNGQKPEKVQNFIALRSNPKKFGERRSIWFKWQHNQLADGYVIHWGKSPDKLYGSIVVYGKNEYYFTGVDRTHSYYF